MPSLYRAITVFVVVMISTVRLSANGTSGSCSGSCNLHPIFWKRIQKDVEWLDEIGGITDGMIRNISLVCNKRISKQCNVKAVRMMIKDGQIYLNSLQPAWRLGPPELLGFLLELYETSKLYRLPDLEFAFNGDDDAASPVFDWEDRKALKSVFHGGPFPLLAWSKSNKSFAQLVPYSGAFRCTDDSFDNLLWHLEEIRRVAWEDKKKIAFGRWNKFCATYYDNAPQLPSGENMVCPRSWLPIVGSHSQDIMDVSVLADYRVGHPGGPVPLLHQSAFRYVVSTDGWAISSKFDKYLLLGSTIIKASSSRFGFYYDALEPGKHYVNCLNKSTTDILDVINWLKEHDSEAASIAVEAQRFAVQHLHRSSRICYYRTLMEELGKRMKYTPDCSKRKMCIPLDRFLDFLSTFGATAHSCRYGEVLLRHGTDTAPGHSAASQWSNKALEKLLANEKLWPFDTDIPPLDKDPYFPGGDD